VKGKVKVVEESVGLVVAGSGELVVEESVGLVVAGSGELVVEEAGE